MTLPVDYFSEERGWEKQPLREPVRMPDPYNGRDSRWRNTSKLLRRVLRGHIGAWRSWDDIKSELYAKLDRFERSRLDDLVCEKVIIEGNQVSRPDGRELRPHEFYVDGDVLCIYKPEQSPKDRYPEPAHEVTMVLRESELYLKMADGFWYCFNLAKSDSSHLGFENAGTGQRFKIESMYYDGEKFIWWPDAEVTKLGMRILSKRRVKGPEQQVSAGRRKRQEHSGFRKQEQRRAARREKIEQRNDPAPSEVYSGYTDYIPVIW